MPQGWVDYTRKPSPASLKKRGYGALFWLNTPGAKQLIPGLPEDAYAADGHYGQNVVIVPSLELVIVRLGMTFESEKFDRPGLYRDILAALL